MTKQGFSTYNAFTKNLKELKQLYDLTFHLYIEENKRIEKILPDSKQAATVTTQIGFVNHSLASLYQLTNKSYPDKLRQLILVNSVTTLEVFLSEIIEEIFQRDTTPFEEQEPADFKKNQIINAPSIKDLKEEIIERDKRKLTSGGLNEIKRYYLKKFKINFERLNVSFKTIEEIHIRRHIQVHRNGLCDKAYANKYPKSGYFAGDRITIEHNYITDSFQKLSEFASEINKELLIKYPYYSKGFTHYHNNVKINAKLPNQKLLVEIKIRKKSFDLEQYLLNLKSKKHELKNYIGQISIKERNCIMIIMGEPDILKKFFKELKSKTEFDLINIIEIKV